MVGGKQPSNRLIIGPGYAGATPEATLTPSPPNPPRNQQVQFLSGVLRNISRPTGGCIESHYPQQGAGRPENSGWCSQIGCDGIGPSKAVLPVRSAPGRWCYSA